MKTKPTPKKQRIDQARKAVEKILVKYKIDLLDLFKQEQFDDIEAAKPTKKDIQALLKLQGSLKHLDDGRPTREIIAEATDRAMRQKFSRYL